MDENLGKMFRDKNKELFLCKALHFQYFQFFCSLITNSFTFSFTSVNFYRVICFFNLLKKVYNITNDA